MFKTPLVGVLLFGEHMQLMLPRGRSLSLDAPVVMGILNTTPDSFSDGGQFQHCELAVQHALDMVRAGASIIDVGGESTRPGAPEVTVDDELNRVIPVITALRKADPDIVISIDTSKTKVMAAALEAGADLINDVRALQDEGAVELAARWQVPVCLMHMQGQPRTMQLAPEYLDVTSDVLSWLLARADSCQKAGVACSQIILDPGFGFGKTVQQNYQLLKDLHKFVATGLPVLAGMSRKSMIGKLLDCETDQRLAGSLACATIAAMQGAQIIRVHDVKETADVLNIVSATKLGVSE
jgi:dihydropteroate synthase